MTVKSVIENTLHIPVQEDLSVAVPNKYATIDIYDEAAELVGDGEEEEALLYYQVDIFYKEVSLETIVKAAEDLKVAIKAAFQCSIPETQLLYEVASRYRRATLRFQMIKE